MNQDQHWDFTLREWNEPKFFEILEEALKKKPKKIFDIGACVGGWSYVVRQHTDAKIEAFEPFNENYGKLVKNIEETKMDVTPHNFGIYYGKTEANASWRGSNIGAIFVDEIDTTMCMPAGQVFQLKTLEEVTKTRPDLIKLDVEGAEKNIIENSKMLQEVPQIIIEWHFNGVENAEEYFAKHLPHKVVKNLEGGMFLLSL